LPPVNGGTIPDPEYYYSGSFIAQSNATGQLSIFGWYDGYKWEGTYISAINGFTIGLVPEPATMVLLGLGGLALLRKHRK
jgi:hypothetical protein